MRRLATALAALSVLGSVALSGGVAAADAPPFTDPMQQGLITLCDGKGHHLTSGDIRTIPFVVKAISSAGVPKGYASGLATLYAYQPIQYVDPGDWTGYQLSGSTYFSNPGHPGAQMTPGDGPLAWFTGGYPLHWNGLLQLRLYYTARFTPQYTGGYPTAILRVSGKRWTAVQVGNTPCNATRTKSYEEIALKPSQYGASSVPTAGAGANGSTTGGPGASSSTGGNGAGGNGTGQTNTAATHRTGGASFLPWLLGIVAAAIGVTVAAAVTGRRRRQRTHDALVNAE